MREGQEGGAASCWLTSRTHPCQARSSLIIAEPAGQGCVVLIFIHVGSSSRDGSGLPLRTSSDAVPGIWRVAPLYAVCPTVESARTSKG